MSIKWRNLAVFGIAALGAAGVAALFGVRPAPGILLFALGVWPCAVIVKMGWLE